MSSQDPALMRLVDMLAAMPLADREFVLAGLAEDECAKLIPLLGTGTGQSFSPALTDLVRRCRVSVPAHLTPRTAEDLLEAARLGDDELRTVQPERARLEPSAWRRLAERLKGRA